MSQTIDELNDAQARHAVQLFYDRLPASAWEGDRKPGSERVGTVMRALAEEAPPHERAALSGLLDDSRPESLAAQAALARLVLRQAAESPALAPLVRQAVEEAAKPTMAVDPVTGVIIVAVLLATTTVDRDADGSLHVHLGGGAAGILSALKVPDLLAKLPAVLGALPANVLSRIL